MFLTKSTVSKECVCITKTTQNPTFKTDLDLPPYTKF